MTTWFLVNSHNIIRHLLRASRTKTRADENLYMAISGRQRTGPLLQHFSSNIVTNTTKYQRLKGYQEQFLLKRDHDKKIGDI